MGGNLGRGKVRAARTDVELVCLLARMIEASRLYHTFGNIDGKSMCCACFPERSSSWSEWKRSTQAIALLSRDRLTMSHDAVSQF